MVKLFCVIMGDENAFPVDIDVNKSVASLKKEIKKETPNTLKDVDADELQLFLTKTKSGWLTENQVHEGVRDTTGFTPLIVMGAPLSLVGLTQEDVRIQVTKEDVAVGRLPVHILVELLGPNTFSYRPPKRLVRTEGAKWDFQNPLESESVAKALQTHYTAWKEKNYDSHLHPLFMCLGGPGTGKSRMLDEFSTLVTSGVFDEKVEDPEMMELLKNAFTFKVSFENETAHHFEFSHPDQAIGTRMLYQLQDKMAWPEFARVSSRHRAPGQVMSILSRSTGIDERRMCVILCVDSMEKLRYGNGSMKSGFDWALSALNNIVNASRCWVIAIFSAATYIPVTEFLLYTSQWIHKVPTAILSRPTVQNVDIFESFGGDELTQLLIDDMGGHGRALEALHGVMSSRAKANQPTDFTSVITGVLPELRSRYPAIESAMEDMKEAFFAVIARCFVNEHSRFGKFSLDDVISTGLVRLEGGCLTCPYVLYLLLTSDDIYPWSKFYSFAPKEETEDVRPWETWEAFNCKFRALRSVACANEEEVPWERIHFGARFGVGCDHVVHEQQRAYTVSTKQMRTDTEGFLKGGVCSCGNDAGRSYVYQPAAGSSSGDSFLCLEDVKRGFFHEVHQYKCNTAPLSLKSIIEAKEKVAGPDDIFVLFCTGEVRADISSLKNCVVVDKTCWKEYYGPFAARAFFLSTVPPPCLNTSEDSQLLLVKGIGRARQEKIVAKRPFPSYDDAHEQTGIPMAVLKRCRLTAPDEVAPSQQ